MRYSCFFRIIFPKDYRHQFHKINNDCIIWPSYLHVPNPLMQMLYANKNSGYGCLNKIKLNKRKCLFS